MFDELIHLNIYINHINQLEHIRHIQYIKYGIPNIIPNAKANINNPALIGDTAILIVPKNKRNQNL